VKRNLFILVGIFLIVLIGVISYNVFHVNEYSIYIDIPITTFSYTQIIIIYRR